MARRLHAAVWNDFRRFSYGKTHPEGLRSLVRKSYLLARRRVIPTHRGANKELNALSRSPNPDPAEDILCDCRRPKPRHPAPLAASVETRYGYCPPRNKAISPLALRASGGSIQPTTSRLLRARSGAFI